MAYGSRYLKQGGVEFVAEVSGPALQYMITC